MRLQGTKKITSMLQKETISLDPGDLNGNELPHWGPEFAS